MSEEVTITSEFVSAGASRHPHSSSVHPKLGLLVYSAGKLLVVVPVNAGGNNGVSDSDTDSNGDNSSRIYTLNAHHANVTRVCWVQSISPVLTSGSASTSNSNSNSAGKSANAIFISADSEGSINVWSTSASTKAILIASVQTSSKSPVSALSACGDIVLVASGDEITIYRLCPLTNLPSSSSSISKIDSHSNLGPQCPDQPRIQSSSSSCSTSSTSHTLCVSQQIPLPKHTLALSCAISADATFFAVSTSKCSVLLYSNKDHVSATNQNSAHTASEQKNYQSHPSSTDIITESCHSENTVPTSKPSMWVFETELHGHSDWVTSVAFTTNIPPSFTCSVNDLENSINGIDISDTRTSHSGERALWLLATGSHDGCARLWRATQSNKNSHVSSEESKALRPIETKQIHLRGNKMISLEAVLIAHDGWVTDVQWSPSTSQLLTSSADRSAIVWNPPQSEGDLWVNTRRLGALNSVAGPGMTSAHWLETGVCASSWEGGWWFWSTAADFSQDREVWQEIVGHSTGGFSAAARDISWSESGHLLCAVSLDRTARIFACVTDDSLRKQWRELARPQRHGYDIQACAFLDPVGLTIATGSEEKVVRLFAASDSFIQQARDLNAVPTHLLETIDRTSTGVIELPVLGLSNKISHDNHISPDENSNSKIVPHEEFLSTRTLWPEYEKIYGHGYEIVSIASSLAHASHPILLASSCRAQSSKHAVIRLHDITSNCVLGEPLTGHSLTITRLIWESLLDGGKGRLLSVGRDRSWRVWSRVIENGSIKSMICTNFQEKSHGRIIWDAAWVPNSDGIFITGSRDKTVKVWHAESSESLCTLNFEQSVTAVAAMALDNGVKIIAVAQEDGTLQIFRNSRADEWSKWDIVQTLCQNSGHINRLLFRPSMDNGIMLAAAGEDTSVRLWNLDFNKKQVK